MGIDQTCLGSRSPRLPLHRHKALAAAIFCSLLAIGSVQAQETTVGSTDEEKGEGENNKPSQGKDQKAPKQLETVQVTGSRLNRTEIEGPQRVNVYSREEIERSGQATVAGFLATLPEVFNGRTGEGITNAYPHSPTVQLRGFPVGSTLVLINGRRPAKSAMTLGSNFNLQNIPASAIDRIEILPEGASAIYGSDAIAGVVNVILKADLDGFEFNTTYGHASGTDEAAANIAWGTQWETGAFTVIASWMHRNPLEVRERPLTSNSDFSRFGGADSRVTTCNPGNVYSVGGGNLPGLNTPSAGIPEGWSSISDYAVTAGVLNRCAINGRAALSAGVDQISIYASFNQSLSESTELFATLLYAHADNFQWVQQYRVSKVRVPAGNPYNPFGTDVLVDYAFERNPYNRNTTDYFQPLVGLRGRFGRNWDWEVAAWGG